MRLEPQMAEAADIPSSVLVVDDEPVVLQLFSRLLSEKGLRTRTASSAEEALKLLEQGGIACVLADKNMPGMDGIEMLRRMREAQPHCAFIVMTGYASTESAIEALRLGAVDYLQKPFEDLDVVAQRIEDAIQQVRSDIDRSAAMARLGVLQDGEPPATEDESDPGAKVLDEKCCSPGSASWTRCGGRARRNRARTWRGSSACWRSTWRSRATRRAGSTRAHTDARSLPPGN